MRDLARTFAALSDDTRLRMVEHLMRHGEQNAGRLTELSGMSAPAVSRHLKVLRGAGLVDQRAEGTQRIYAARPEAIGAISGWTIEHRAFWSGSLDRLDALLALDPNDTEDAMADDAATTHDLEFIRDYEVSVDRLWRAVTAPDEVVQWFGPEGVDLERCEMDLTRRGPWSCLMVGRESGNRFKVTGQVTHVRPPKGGGDGSVGFTWAWHDAETDERGPESHVIFEVSSHNGRARLRLVHRELDSAESAQGHSKGWLSTLRRLDAHLAR